MNKIKNYSKHSVVVVVALMAGFAVNFSSCSSKVDTTPPTVLKQVFYPTSTLIVGADLSSVNMVEDQGGIYSDSGTVQDPFVIFKKHGCNMVRVRLFKDPIDGGYSSLGYGGIADVTKTIKRAKDAGMSVCLDLHFSDTWADPTHQKTPSAWTNAPINILKDSVYNYVYSVLSYIHNRGYDIDMIQIGNEIQGGMLFPAGQIAEGDYTNLATLVKAGIGAVHGFAGDNAIAAAKIILHPGEPDNAQAFFAGITGAGVTNFDVPGLSYYDEFSKLTFDGLASAMKSILASTGKNAMVVECSYQHTNFSHDGKEYHDQVVLNGYNVSIEGQLAYMLDITQHTIGAKGLGVIAWEPAWIATSVNFDHETMAFFTSQGRTLDAINFFNYPYVFE